MAITQDAINKINNIEKRIKVAEYKLNDIFKNYKIPQSAIKNFDKLNFALAEIGNDQKARKVLKDQFNKINENMESMLEDFNNMVNIGKEGLDNLTEKLQKEEEELSKDLANKENDKKRSEELKNEIEGLIKEKDELGGPDGRGGKIADEMAKSSKIKKEQKDITKKIEDLKAKMETADKEIKDVTNLMNSAKTKEEMDKYKERLEKLNGDKSILEDNKSDLNVNFQNKENDKRVIEENIRKMESQYLKYDSDIISKTADKSKIDNSLRILPNRKPELEKIKKDFKQVDTDFKNIVNKQINNLERLGFEVDKNKVDKISQATKVPTIDNEKYRITDSELGFISDSQIGANPQLKNQEQTQSASKELPYSKPVAYAYPEKVNNNLLARTQGAIKEEKLKYILGQNMQDNMPISSQSRLERLKGNFSNNDYSELVTSFKVLENSSSGLTRSEKNELKQMMEEDKSTLAEMIKEVAEDGFGNKFKDMLDSVGIRLSVKEAESLRKNSYKKVDSDNFVEIDYGIISGFDSMNKKDKMQWKKIVESYGNSKQNLTKDQREDFEKYVITPLKFGTLQELNKVACKGKISKFFSKILGGVEDQKIKDIRSAINDCEKNTIMEDKPIGFKDVLRQQIVQEPPEPQMQNQQNKERTIDSI